MNVEQWREKGFRGSFHNLEFRFKIWSKIHSIWFYGIYFKYMFHSDYQYEPSQEYFPTQIESSDTRSLVFIMRWNIIILFETK